MFLSISGQQIWIGPGLFRGMPGISKRRWRMPWPSHLYAVIYWWLVGPSGTCAHPNQLDFFPKYKWNLSHIKMKTYDFTSRTTDFGSGRLDWRQWRPKQSLWPAHVAVWACVSTSTSPGVNDSLPEIVDHVHGTNQEIHVVDLRSWMGSHLGSPKGPGKNLEEEGQGQWSQTRILEPPFWDFRVRGCGVCQPGWPIDYTPICSFLEHVLQQHVP